MRLEQSLLSVFNGIESKNFRITRAVRRYTGLPYTSRNCRGRFYKGGIFLMTLPSFLACTLNLSSRGDLAHLSGGVLLSVTQ